MILRLVSRLALVSLVALRMVAAPADAPRTETWSFKHGVNISHWLSQNYGERTYGAPWFGAADIAWIARQGFDHIRLPVDVRLCVDAKGQLDDARLKPIRDAIAWCKAQHLAVVLDAHFLPGADFNATGVDKRVYTALALQEQVAGIWRDLARRFKDEGPWLRFEILNEPVAEQNKDLNPFMHRMLAAIRETNPTRVVYVTSNRWSAFKTVTDVVLPDDPAIAIDLHTYEPFVFTHQRTGWTGFKETMPPIAFPGTVPDLTEHHDSRAHPPPAGTKLTEDGVRAGFDAVERWVKATRPGLEVYVGEFGVYRAADPESTQRWTHLIVSECEKRGWGWAVWDYAGGFAIRGRDKEGSAVLNGLGLHRKE